MLKFLNRIMTPIWSSQSSNKKTNYKARFIAIQRKKMTNHDISVHEELKALLEEEDADADK